MTEWVEENWDDDDQTPAKTYVCYNDNQNNSFSKGRQHNSARGHDGGKRNNYQRHEHSQSINIPSDCIGLVIGRSGANIKRVQNDFHVRVDLNKISGVATISGNNEQDVNDAYKHIENQMDSGGRDSYGGSRSAGESSGNYHFKREENEEWKSGRSNNYTTEKSSYSGEQTESKFTGIIDWDAANRRAIEEKAKRWAKCPPLTKNFYKEDPEVANLPPKEVARIRKKNNDISVSRVFKQDDDSDIPNPIWKFEQCFGAYPDLLNEIHKQEFIKPSPIQSQAWPILLKGEDMIGIAQTGTGKTLAFLLPAMIHTEYQSTPRSQRGGPNVLVLAPTRELALQIEKEVNKYSFRGMKA